MSESAAPTAPGVEYTPLLSPLLENPHPFYARIRREAPLFYSPVVGAWVVTRHADVVAVLADPARFSSANSFSVGAIQLPGEVLEILQQGLPPLGGLVNSDPPAHTRLRGLVSKAFTLRRIEEREPFIRASVNTLVDGFARQGRADLFRHFANPLSARVIAGLLGIPEGDIDAFMRWSHEWISMLAAHDPVEVLCRYARGVLEFQRYLVASLESREQAPREDILTDVVVAARTLEPRPHVAELVGMLMQVLFAGYETTAGLITGAMELLLRNPGALEALRQEPGLVSGVVEESLRMTTPVGCMFRTTTEEVELGGVKLPKGAHLRLSFASACRDEAVFEDSQRFNPHRAEVKKHLAFGHGIHYCIGAPLARLEARIALEELTRRLPGLRLVPEQTPDMLRSLTIRRLGRLEVEWDV